MAWLTTFLYWIATIELVCLVILAVGVALVVCFTRPIERLRTIQATFAAMAVACLLQAMHVLPQASLGWLAAAEPVEASVKETRQLAGNEHASLATSGSVASSIGFSYGTSPDSALQVPISGKAASSSRQQLIESESTVTTAAVGQHASKSAMGYVGIVLLAVFSGGALWSFLHLVPGVVLLRRIWRRSKPVPDALMSLLDHVRGPQAHSVALRMSSDITVPMAFGLRRGTILLPESVARGADYDTLRYCLAHEWSHIRNYDIVQWWGVQLCQAVLWCQPLYWLVRREMRVCQDQIADDFAAGLTPDPLPYAQLLIDLARRSHKRHLTMALTMCDGRSSLFRRIRLLTEGNSHLAAICRPRALVTATCALTIATVSLALVDLAGAQDHDRGAQASTAAVTSTAASDDGQSPSSDVSNTPGREDDDSGTDNAAPGQPAATDKPQSSTPAPAKDEKNAGSPAKDDKPAEAKALKYFGVVADKETKEPIEGAKVTVRRSILTSTKNEIVEETKHTTDDKGVFRFVIPPEQVAEPMMYIELDVEHPNYASKTGFGYSLAMIIKNLKKGDPPFFTRTVLDPAEAVTGRLVDAAGKPLAGVAIQAYSVGAPSSPGAFEYGSFTRISSAADGTFRMNLVKDGQGMLWIVPDKQAPRQLLLAKKKGDLGDVQLADGIATGGQVVDAEGKPVADVWVNVVDEAAQSEIQMPVATSLRRSAKADAEGRFQLDPLKPGSYKLTIEERPMDIRFESRHEPILEVPAVFVTRTITISEPAQPILIQAAPHVLFIAQYRNSKGENCRGHEFYVFGRMNGESYFAHLRPDNNGHVEGKLPHGLEQAQLNLSTNEHSSLRYRVANDKPLERSTHQPIMLGTIDHDIVDVEIVRYVAPIVTVKIVDEDGHRISDAKVAGVYVGAEERSMLSPVGGLPTHIFFEKQIDGRRRSSQMLPDEKMKFIAQAEGYENAEQELSLPESEERELVLTLKRATEDTGAAAGAADGSETKSE